VNHFVDRDASTPISRPPANASGRLLNAPDAAAPGSSTGARIAAPERVVRRKLEKREFLGLGCGGQDGNAEMS
jgi:hypothetical protein